MGELDNEKGNREETEMIQVVLLGSMAGSKGGLLSFDVVAKYFFFVLESSLFQLKNPSDLIFGWPLLFGYSAFHFVILQKTNTIHKPSLFISYIQEIVGDCIVRSSAFKQL